MQRIRHYITIDMLREAVNGTQYIRQRSAGHELCVTFTQGGKALAQPVGGSIYQLVYRLPDGTKGDLQMERYGDGAKADLPLEVTEQPGVVDCEIRIYQRETPGTWTTTPRFTLTIGEAIFSEEDMDAITDAGTLDVDDVEDVTEALAEIWNGHEITRPEVQKLKQETEEE